MGLEKNEYIYRRYFSWQLGERTLDYGEGRKKGGEGEREDEHEKQDGPFVRVGQQEINTHIDPVPVPSEKHDKRRD